MLWPDLSRGRGAKTVVDLILFCTSPLAVAGVGVAVDTCGVVSIVLVLVSGETLSSTRDGGGEPEALMFEPVRGVLGGGKESQEEVVFPFVGYSVICLWFGRPRGYQWCELESVLWLAGFVGWGVKWAVAAEGSDRASDNLVVGRQKRSSKRYVVVERGEIASCSSKAGFVGGDNLD